MKAKFEYTRVSGKEVSEVLQVMDLCEALFIAHDQARIRKQHVILGIMGTELIIHPFTHEVN